MHREFPKFLLELPEAKWDYAYGPGKWTLKEVLQHIIDTERVFAYRLLRISRGDKTPLPGFDENEYVNMSNARDRDPDALIDEYINVRRSTISLIDSLPNDVLLKMGTASDHPISVRALVYIIAGHEQHHLSIIRERYLI